MSSWSVLYAKVDQLNILHIVSQLDLTGAGSFVASLADVQVNYGQTVFIISEKSIGKTDAAAILHPIEDRQTANQLKNISFLKNCIKVNAIDIVHVHSESANLICYVATRSGDTALVSSIYLNQQRYFQSKISTIYGEKIVTVSKSINDHLNRRLKFSLETMSLITNGIDLTKWKYYDRNRRSVKQKIVSYVEQYSFNSNELSLTIIEKIFPKVFEQFKDVELHIIQRTETTEIMTAVKRTNALIGSECILMKGFTPDAGILYQNSDMIIGSGRVAMEALASGTPVVIAGESDALEIVSPDAEREAVSTNFGHFAPPKKIDTEKSIRTLLYALEHPEQISTKWGRKLVEENFNIHQNIVQLNKVYAEAIAKKKGITEIPVLLYHRISKGGGIGRVVAASEFEKQLQYLKKNGFIALNFQSMDDIGSGRRIIPDKPIILTFESYADNYTFASQLLKKYDFTAVFFLQTDCSITDGEEPLTFGQAKELQSNGFEIGSASHGRPKLNLITNEEITREIEGSKLLIEKTLGSEVISFAYPYGFVNEKIKQTVKNSGYKFAVTIDEGRRNFWVDFFKIRRIQIFGGASTFSFWKKTSGRYLWYKYVY